MYAINNFEILPVIELEPYDFRKKSYNPPEKTLSEDPKAWENYNQNSYKDSELTNLEPIKTGSWLFDITKLSDDNLKIIFANLFKKDMSIHEHSLEDILDDLDNAPLINGGYLVIINNKIVSSPGCCCGLETIKEWLDSVNEFSSKIWTGHDMGCEYIQYTKDEQDDIYLTIDDNTYKIEMDSYEKEIRKLKRTIEIFINRLAPLLEELLNIDTGKKLIKAMIYHA